MSDEKMTSIQHVVPKVYLKRFATSNMCHIINGYGKIKYDQSIKRICYEDKYYELRAADRTIVNPNLTEKNLGIIETKYSSFFDDMFEALEAEEVRDFMRDEDNGLCLITWMVIMLLRNPLVFKLTPEVAMELGIEWDEIQSHNNAILNISALTEHFSHMLYKNNKIVFFKNGTNISFLTGNYPCIIREFHRGSRGYMPLSPQYYVLLVDKNDKSLIEHSVNSVPKAVVDYYNYEIISNVLNFETDVKHKYIISKDKKTLEYYHEYIKKQVYKKSQ